MHDRQLKTRFGIILAVVGLAFNAVTVLEAADQGEVDYKLKARGLSAVNIERAAYDLIDIRVTRLSTEAERQALISILEGKGNHALAAALADQAETGWVQFDPRGGGGSGRDPRKTTLRYAREFEVGDTKDLILLTDQYIGYGGRADAADGSKLANYPLSFVLMRFKKDAKGEWKGIGRLFVGAKVRYDSVNKKFVIDAFASDPVYLKDVTIK